MGSKGGGEGVGEEEEEPEKTIEVEEEVMERALRVPGTKTASTNVIVRESAAMEMTGGSGVEEEEGRGGEAEGREQSKFRPVMVMSGPAVNVSGVRHVIWVSVTVMLVCVLTWDCSDEMSTAVAHGTRRRVSKVRRVSRVRREGDDTVMGLG